MLNLRPYATEDASTTHRGVVLSLRDENKRDSLSAIEASIFEQFELHRNHSLTNTLEQIDVLQLSEELKQNLRSLYSSRRRKIIEIKNSVITSETNRVNNLCQYCTINTVGPMDHIMPKDRFPEFSVHSQNIFPCCAECNSMKSEVWLAEGNRQFLNLYLDILPDQRYLFVRIQNANTVPEVEFYLENANGINPKLFGLISSHYERLNLLDRFNLSSDSVISDLRFTLESLSGHLTLQEARTATVEGATRRLAYHGSNYWKCVLEIALVESDDFLSSFWNQ